MVITARHMNSNSCIFSRLKVRIVYDRKVKHDIAEMIAIQKLNSRLFILVPRNMVTEKTNKIYHYA
jgi:hypothetical protein